MRPSQKSDSATKLPKDQVGQIMRGCCRPIAKGRGRLKGKDVSTWKSGPSWIQLKHRAVNPTGLPGVRSKL